MVEIKCASSAEAQGDPLSPTSIDRHEENKYRLLYSKSKVYVNPTAYARDNIPGFVALVKRVSAIGIHVSCEAHRQVQQEAINPSYLLAWIPEGLLNEKGSTEWDKFVKIEERAVLDDEDDGTHALSFSNYLGLNKF
jgi:hypothetical protein